MPDMARFRTANEIINSVALQVGLSEVSDPVASEDPAFKQMAGLLTICGKELLYAHPWEHLLKEHSITTSSADSGDYTLPDDFCRMIDQTGWDRTNERAIYGSMSPQTWQYAVSAQQVISTLYVSFRQMAGVFKVFPRNPVPDAIDIYFEYLSRGWVESGTSPGTYRDHIVDGSDLVRYEEMLITSMLKMRFLGAKGFDNTAATGDFLGNFDRFAGAETSAPILNLSNRRRETPLLGWHNTPDTGYGT